MITTDQSYSSLTTEIITIYVGHEKELYNVHAGILSQYPSLEMEVYSNAEFLNSFHLADCQPDVFGALLNWIYRKNLTAISTTDKKEAIRQARLYSYLYLYVEELDMQDLQNYIMDIFRARTTCPLEWFPTDVIGDIYDYTASDSQLRKYIVDVFVSRSCSWASGTAGSGGRIGMLMRDQSEAGNHQFVAECYGALAGMAQKSKSKNPNRKAKCLYHVHVNGKKCK